MRPRMPTTHRSTTTRVRARASSRIRTSATRSFLDFAADNQDLGAELLATAPDAIADDVAVVVDAFRLAGDGDLSGYDTDYYAARGRIRGYELVNCQIFRFN